MAKAVLSHENGLTHTLHIQDGDSGGLEVTHQHTQDIQPFLEQAERARNENATYWKDGKVRDLVHLCDIPYVVAHEIKQKTGFDMWKANFKDPAVKVELFAIMKRLGHDNLWLKKNPY